jgi:hypothetical protein
LVQSAARRTRLRNGAVLAGSVILHAAILAALAWSTGARFPDRSNDEDAITVTLNRSPIPHRPTPQAVASSDRAAAASPLRPRAPRLVAPSSVTPLGVAAVPAPGPSAGRGIGVHPAPLPEGPRGDLRTALRGSSVGCANAEAVGLNRRELEHCDERLGAAVRNALVYGAPMDPMKRNAFEQQAIRQRIARAQREAQMGPGVDHRSREGPGTMKEIPWVLGAEQDGLGNSQSPAQQQLKRLDDARKADERRKKAARENEQQ